MYFPLWTLVSMFFKSISPLLTPQHLQNSSMPCWSLWSSTIQRLTNTTTQQWHNTHLLSYTSTLMRFKEKEALVSYSQNIHIPEGTSVSSSKFTKKGSLKVPRFLASSLSRPSILLQQKLNYPSNVAEDH
jgi:hypothetical protein